MGTKPAFLVEKSSVLRYNQVVIEPFRIRAAEGAEGWARRALSGKSKMEEGCAAYGAGTEVLDEECGFLRKAGFACGRA